MVAAGAGLGGVMYGAGVPCEVITIFDDAAPVTFTNQIWVRKSPLLPSDNMIVEAWAKKIKEGKEVDGYVVARSVYRSRFHVFPLCTRTRDKNGGVNWWGKRPIGAVDDFQRC